jgi:putative transposase
VEPELAYHVTQRGSNRQRVFFSPMDYRMYLSLVGEQLEDAGVSVLAYCLMTNHVHWIVVPSRPDSLAVLFRRVHGRYSQYLNTRRRRTGHLWQSRYFSCPLSDTHLWSAVRYVEQNPCRAQMIVRPEDYRWSSAGAHLLGTAEQSKLIDQEFWRLGGGTEGWKQLHASADSPAEIQLLRRCTYSGRPFGSEEFVQQLEARFQRVWRRWGSERSQTA